MAPKPSTRPRNAGQPNEAEKKVQCGTCGNDSWILLVVSAVLLSPSQLLEHSLLANEQQWMPEPLQQEVSNHWLLETLQEKLDVDERAGDEGAVKKIRASCPELVSKD